MTRIPDLPWLHTQGEHADGASSDGAGGAKQDEAAAQKESSKKLIDNPAHSAAELQIKELQSRCAALQETVEVLQQDIQLRQQGKAGAEAARPEEEDGERDGGDKSQELTQELEQLRKLLSDTKRTVMMPDERRILLGRQRKNLKSIWMVGFKSSCILKSSSKKASARKALSEKSSKSVEKSSKFSW